MLKKLFKKIFFILFLIGHLPVHALEEMSIEQFVKNAKKANLNLQYILHQKNQLAYLKDLNLEDSKIILSATAAKSFIDQTQKNSDNLKFGLTQEYQPLGFAWSLEVEKTNLKQNDTSYIAKITQQLLYNSFGSLHKIQNQKQDLKADILKLNLSEFYEDYLTTLMHYFYDYYETYINYETAKQNLAESKRLLEDINKRFRANIALENDVALIKVQVLESESAQDKALLAFVNHKFLLENEIGISNFKPKLPSLNIDIKAELADIKKIIKNSRTASLYELQNDQAACDITYYENIILPKFNIFATRTDNDTALGLAYQMNFGAKAEPAKLKEAQYNLAHTKQENVLQKKSLYLSLINLKNQFDYLKTQINKYETMYHLYESIVKTEENDYHIGKEQLEQLVRAINKKNQYKQKINTLLVQKQKVYLEWLRLTDSLVK